MGEIQVPAIFGSQLSGYVIIQIQSFGITTRLLGSTKPEFEVCS
jgi:hypothetical protein